MSCCFSIAKAEALWGKRWGDGEERGGVGVEAPIAMISPSPLTGQKHAVATDWEKAPGRHKGRRWGRRGRRFRFQIQ